jgi:hypothetical protein
VLGLRVPLLAALRRVVLVAVLLRAGLAVVLVTLVTVLATVVGHGHPLLSFCDTGFGVTCLHLVGFPEFVSGKW